MKPTIRVATLLATVAISSSLLAHEGHHHDAMGTVEAIGAEQISLAVNEEETLTFVLTEATEFKRGDESVPREDVLLGERAVVMYEKKDGVNAAVEVKLAPSPE